jgi:environmental stress-induced protein Ves
VSLRVLRAADRQPVPWKNGGGVTTEVAVHPPGSGFDDFDWRISLANVDADGPFSMFPGVDRNLTLLEGRVRLSIDGRVPVDLTASSPPFAFPGDVPVSATLLAGPALDLNVMVRRGRLSCEVSPLALPANHELPSSPGQALLILTEGEARLAHAGGAIELRRFDAVLFDASLSGARLESAAPGRAHLVVSGPPSELRMNAARSVGSDRQG